MSSSWTPQEAAHLLSRAAFSATQEEVNASVRLGRAETVRRLLAGESLTGKPHLLKPFEEVKADNKQLKADSIGDQQTYWLYRMVNNEAPLLEKMTLFWHGHFATSFQKVKRVPLMVQQNELFRSYALGNFHDLVVKMGTDPAMMYWLDSNSNKKGRPNENYAREVMELFTLGIGNYTEEDIKETAKAFTGWNVNRDTGLVRFNKNQHDTSIKQVLGETGNYNEKTVVDVLFNQKALSLFMGRKILEYFAADDPSPEWVLTVANDFQTKRTVGEVLSNLFISDEFYKPEYRRSMIKTPAEYVAGILRSLDIPISTGFASSLRKMGQELYLPPDVAGWNGGVSWLMSSSILARYTFAESIADKMKSNVLGSAPFKPKDVLDAYAWVDLWSSNLGLQGLSRETRNALARYAEDTFVHSKQRTAGMRGLLHLLLISPEAQMK